MKPAQVVYRSTLEDSARWQDVAFRHDDIVISTPAKCGTTWTQMICALLIFRAPELPRTLNELSPFVDLQIRSRDELARTLEAQRHRRFLKTHTPLDGLPFHEHVTYIFTGRDPRDVALSQLNQSANMNREKVLALREAAAGPVDPGAPVGSAGLAGRAAPGDERLGMTEHDRFWQWMDSDDPLGSLTGLIHHLETFWAVRHLPNVVLLHYDDLQADLEGQMRGLADRLGITIAEAAWPDLVHAASFEQMKRRPQQLAPEPAIWHDTPRFFRRGTSGQWRDLLDDADQRRYAASVARLAGPELTAWLHRTPLVE